MVEYAVPSGSRLPASAPRRLNAPNETSSASPRHKASYIEFPDIDRRVFAEVVSKPALQGSFAHPGTGPGRICPIECLAGAVADDRAFTECMRQPSPIESENSELRPNGWMCRGIPQHCREVKEAQKAGGKGLQRRQGYEGMQGGRYRTAARERRLLSSHDFDEVYPRHHRTGIVSCQQILIQADIERIGIFPFQLTVLRSVWYQAAS